MKEKKLFKETIKKIGEVKTYNNRYKKGSEEKFFIVFASELKSMFPKEAFGKIKEGDTIEFEATDGVEWINVDRANFEFVICGATTTTVQATTTTSTTTEEPEDKEIEVEVGYITRPKKNKRGRVFVMARQLKDQLVTNLYINLDAIPTDIKDEVLQGYGVLKVKGNEGKEMFFANEVLSFEPVRREEDVEVELKDVRFSIYFISFVVGDRKITIPVDEVPFDCSPVFEKIKSEFKGSIKVTGTFRKVGSFKKNKQSKQWEEQVYWEEEGEIKVDYSDIDTDSIQKIQQKYNRDLEYSKLMALLRRTKGYRSFSGIKKMFATKGISISTKEIEGLYWDEKYDKEYYNTLKRKADEIYVSDEEFVFVMRINEGDREFRIVERPTVNSATYVFDNTCGMDELLHKLKETRKMDIISNQIVAGKSVQTLLGYKGRIVHQDYEDWVEKIEKTIGDGIAVELEDKFIW